MKQRYFVIILMLVIGLGANAHPVGAADCAKGNACMPIHGAVHSTGGHHHLCSCGLWSEPAGHSCRLKGFLWPIQPAIVPPASHYPVLSALGFPAMFLDRIPELDRRGLLPQRLNKTESPLSYPIYLNTLALLC